MPGRPFGQCCMRLFSSSDAQLHDQDLDNVGNLTKHHSGRPVGPYVYNERYRRRTARQRRCRCHRRGLIVSLVTEADKLIERSPSETPIELHDRIPKEPKHELLIVLYFKPRKKFLTMDRTRIIRLENQTYVISRLLKHHCRNNATRALIGIVPFEGMRRTGLRFVPHIEVLLRNCVVRV